MLARWRRSKNSGGGIAPTAIGPPYKGMVLQRQRLPDLAGNGRPPAKPFKVLIMLNLPSRPDIGDGASGCGGCKVTHDPGILPTCGTLAAGRRVHIHGL